MGRLLIVLTIGIAGMIATSNARKKWAEVKVPFQPPPRHIEHLHFGYREPLGDVLWIRLLQDLGACRVEGEEQDLPADGAHKCEKGWTFRMADAITNLCPRFRIAYDASATLLSIVGGDAEGARVIFEKAIVQFPKDWQLQYRAAYHYMFEVKNLERAAELLQMAGRNGAPQWVFALAARLYTRSGQAELGRSVLLSYLEEFPDGAAAEIAKRRLRELEEGVYDVNHENDKDPQSQ